MKTKSKTKSRRNVPAVKELPYQGIARENVFETGAPQPEPFGDLEEAYAAHVWVYACVYAIANNLASLEYLPYVQDEDGGWALNQKHEFYKLLTKPNAYMTARDLRYLTFMSLELTGNAYWVLEKAGRADVSELWPLPASYVMPVTTKDKFIDHYVLRINGQEKKFDYREIIHFRSPNPKSMIYGQGSVTAAKRTITSDLYAEAWNTAFFKFATRPDAFIETDQSLGDETRTRLARSFRKMSEGVRNRGKTVLLEGGLKYHEVNRSPKDLDFVLLRKHAREEILAAFGVPPAVVGVFEYANYANSREQIKIFWTQTLIPKMRSFQEMLTMRAAQETFNQRTVIEADTSKVEALRADEMQRSMIATNYVNIGVPLNQVIEALDLPFESVEGGDESRRPVQIPPEPNGGPNEDTTKHAHKAAVPVPALLSEEAKAVLKAAEDVRKRDLAKRIDAAKDLDQTIEWKRFDRDVQTRIDQMEQAMRAFFKGQARRVMAKFRANAERIARERGAEDVRTKQAGDTVDIIFDMDAEMRAMRKAAGKHIRGTYYEFAVRMTERLKPGFAFDLQNPIAAAWIDAKTIKLVQVANEHTKEAISDAVREAIEDALSEGFSESETIDQIADRIEEVHEFAVKHRADRIARTEIISASNAGSTEAMRNAGVERKEWLNSRSGDYRETHDEMRGQVVGIHETFISPEGNKLMFPGDPSAPPGEIINCRCTVLPVFADTERAANPDAPRIVFNPVIKVQAADVTFSPTVKVDVPAQPKVVRVEKRVIRDESGKTVGMEDVPVYEKPEDPPCR